MAEAPPGTPRRLARSSSGVWWKLGGDAASPEVERRLRGIAEEEAAVRAHMERRRKVALASMSLEVAAFFSYGLWRARRRRPIIAIALGWRLMLPVPALAIPAILLAAAFARFRKILDARDEQKLRRLAAERKANIGSFRGSYHNLQRLVDKYDPDAADNKDDDESAAAAAAAAAGEKLKRTHSRRLSFHLGDE